MARQAYLYEYLEEIRKQVCSRCVERPQDGPPCAPLLKFCRIETHLREIIDSIHQIKSELIEPDRGTIRKRVWEGCAFLHSLSMDSAVLLMQAVETVDDRHARRTP